MKKSWFLTQYSEFKSLIKNHAYKNLSKGVIIRSHITLASSV